MAARKLDAAYMKEVSKGLKTVFNDALKSHPTNYNKLSTEIRANTVTVDYAWLADFPSMREWVGDRVLNELKAHKYTISKKDWETSIGVHRDVIQYDNLGLVKPRIQGMAEAVFEHYEEMVFGLLEKNDICYDGKAFFAKDHDIGGVSFSNLGERAFSQAALLETIAEMKRLVKDNGRALRIRPSLLVVPPELYAAAKKVVEAVTLDNGSSNITHKIVELLECDALSDAKAWYLFDTTRALKPIILQINKGGEFVAQDRVDDEAAFMRKEFRYGVDTEDNVGYGLWQLAYKNKPTN